MVHIIEKGSLSCKKKSLEMVNAASALTNQLTTSVGEIKKFLKGGSSNQCQRLPMVGERREGMSMPFHS